MPATLSGITNQVAERVAGFFLDMHSQNSVAHGICVIGLETATAIWKIEREAVFCNVWAFYTLK